MCDWMSSLREWETYLNATTSSVSSALRNPSMYTTSGSRLRTCTFLNACGAHVRFASTGAMASSFAGLIEPTFPPREDSNDELPLPSISSSGAPARTYAASVRNAYCMTVKIEKEDKADGEEDAAREEGEEEGEEEEKPMTWLEIRDTVQQQEQSKPRNQFRSNDNKKKGLPNNHV